MNSEDVQLSKFLSFVLRHRPESIGIVLDESGWVDIEILLKACADSGKAITIAKLKHIVETNDKKRFMISPDGKRVRASQGHSLSVELGYEPAKPPARLFHGTASRFIESIKKKGLHRGKRHHVHLCLSEATALSVGSRYGKPVLLKIDSARMHQDGYLFFLSDNNVWLTESVPFQYIEFPGE